MGFFQDLLTDDREVTPHLQDVVPAGADDHEVIWKVPEEGTIEEMTVWAVPGSEDALKLRPVVRGGANEPEKSIPNYGDGEQHITGEPQGDQYKMNQPVEAGDEIVVYCDNDSADYDYRFRVLPVVDYAGGLSRVLGGNT